MPIKRTKTKDELFPVETIRLETTNDEEAIEHANLLKVAIAEALDFERELRLAEEAANKVLAEHPNRKSTLTATSDDDPLIVIDALDLLNSIPKFEKALAGDDPRESGIRGFYCAMTYVRMLARRHEGVAAAGAKQRRGASKGGKSRSTTRRWTIEQARRAEEAIAAGRRGDPNSKMPVIEARVAQTFGLSRAAMLGRIRRAKDSLRRS